MGRRIPDGTWWHGAHDAPWRIGDYCLDVDRGGVWIQVPHGDEGVPVHLRTQHAPPDVPEPRWTLTEHDDGTLTLTPSIFVNAPTGWHGWLTAGHLVDTAGAPVGA